MRFAADDHRVGRSCLPAKHQDLGREFKSAARFCAAPFRFDLKISFGDRGQAFYL
jgi:hypothetical protein